MPSSLVGHFGFPASRVESGDTKNPDYSHWNRMSVCFRSGYKTISGLAGAILRFRYRSTLADVGDESVESGEPENLSITTGTACLSVVARKI